MTQTVYPASPRQRDLLSKLGYAENLDALTSAQASDLIEARKGQLDSIVEAAKRKAQGINLIEFAGEQVKLNGKGNEQFGACPKCGGDDRFHVAADWFFCRQCHAQRGDALEYIQWIDGKDFMTVCLELTGNQAFPTVAARPVAIVQPTIKPQPQRATPDERWIASATKEVEDAKKALFTNNNAEPAREYLEGRGIEPYAWEAFSLGYKPDVALPGTWDEEKRTLTQPKQPAIVIPWYRGGKVMAIRYRFLETHEYMAASGKQTTAKQTARYGSMFEGGLYGGHVLTFPDATPHENGQRIQALRTLVICEGEFNAISIWQIVTEWGWDVMSLGSESAKLSAAAIKYAAAFERAIIWMDRPEVTKSMMAEIPRCYGLNSLPVLDAKGKPATGADGKPLKRDANDLLRDGLLGGFLAQARFQACETDEERRRLLFGLWDTFNGLHGLDDGSMVVMSQINEKLKVWA